MAKQTYIPEQSTSLGNFIDCLVVDNMQSCPERVMLMGRKVYDVTENRDDWYTPLGRFKVELDSELGDYEVRVK